MRDRTTLYGDGRSGFVVDEIYRRHASRVGVRDESRRAVRCDRYGARRVPDGDRRQGRSGGQVDRRDCGRDTSGLPGHERTGVSDVGAPPVGSDRDSLRSWPTVIGARAF